MDELETEKIIENFKVPHVPIIFVIGGQDGVFEDINNIEVYNPDTRKWTVHSDLTIPRECTSLVNL